jgi:hypothetical protein
MDTADSQRVPGARYRRPYAVPERLDLLQGPSSGTVPVLAEISHGFDRLLFADALGALTQITDAAFAEYGTDPGMIADMRNRFAQWRRGLLAAGTS